jgi:hypothetical protein
LKLDPAVLSYIQAMGRGISDQQSVSGAHVDVSADRGISDQESGSGARIQVSATPMTEYTSHDVIPVSIYLCIMDLYKRT